MRFTPSVSFVYIFISFSLVAILIAHWHIWRSNERRANSKEFVRPNERASPVKTRDATFGGPRCSLRGAPLLSLIYLVAFFFLFYESAHKLRRESAARSFGKRKKKKKKA